MVERGSKMEVALFFIFLITNLFVVLICQYSYGKRDQYENGMLMGVHIPASALEQEEVKTICAKSKKEWRLFNRGNLIVSILITFLCFWDISFFIIIYFVWMIEYMCGLWCLVIFPHRKMYEIKKQNQWIDERSRRVVPVDTEITSFLDKKPWSVRWYIPLFILLFLSGIWEKEIWTGGMEFYGERIIFLSTLGISVVFFLIHIGVSKKQDVVYSEHREINLAANQLGRRPWTIGLVTGAWIYGMAWFFLALESKGKDWIEPGVYIVYFILLAISVLGLLLPIMWGIRKQKKVLLTVAEPYSIDDDEYWRKGWYNNPKDPHLFVQDRLNSINLSMNYGRPAAKIILGVTGALTAGIVIWVLVIILRFENVDIYFQQTGDSFLVEAAGYECEFTKEEIVEVTLLNEMPDDKFIRTNGGSTNDYDIGYFKGKETGKCMLFVDKATLPILEIQLKDQMIFIAGNETEDTENWYRLVVL